MSDDIVTRLRAEEDAHKSWDMVPAPLYGQAADEIERLVEENRRIKAELLELIRENRRWSDQRQTRPNTGEPKRTNWHNY